MCLARVTKKIEKPTNAVVRAWGRFDFDCDYDKNTLSQLRFPYHSSTEVSFNKWMKANNWQNGDPPYLLGFHKYRYKKSAVAECNSEELVIPVQLRKVRTMGKQGDCLVLVADEMRVLKTDAVKAYNDYRKKRNYR